MKLILKLSVAFLVPLFIPSCSSSVSLFDGKTLEGWECDPVELTSHWKAENGELLGENPDKEGSVLWTTKSYGDFEIECEYITLSDDYDTGLFIRNPSHQVQIGVSRSLQKDMTACIYAPMDDRGNYPGQSDKVAEFHKIGEWNHLKVIVTGKRIQTVLNGESMVDYTGVVLEDEGPVGLQLHGGVHMAMKFRNIRIRESSSDI
jgi:hypothetical protein